MLKDEIIKTYGNRVRIRVCGILIIDDQILLTKQQLNKTESNFWSPPGGGLEFGETIENCLQREFLEETGLTIEAKSFININEHIDGVLHSVELFYFVEKNSGNLSVGYDPELSTEEQTIKNCTFVDLQKIQNDEKNSFHPLLFQLISKK